MVVFVLKRGLNNFKMFNMRVIGLRFFIDDGSVDCYDSVHYETQFIETEESYIIDNDYGEWTIPKNTVVKYEKYDLCYGGYELLSDTCGNIKCMHCQQ